MQFSDTTLDPRWTTALAAQGLTEPTPVQRAVWEPFLGRRDLVVRSGTGTGKTLAYLLPLVQTLDPGRKDLQALILVPTQELAVQIQRVMDGLCAGSGLRHLALLGGVNLPRQVEMLKAKPHLAVGTPGRILELLEKKKVTGHFLTTVVLDEADRLLADASLPTVKAILKTTLKTRQTVLFSASIPAGAEKAAGEFLKDPLRIDLDPAQPIPAGIAHWSFTTERQEKADFLRKVVHSVKPKRTLVFLNQPDQIEVLAAKLRHHGLKAESLHGSLFKEDRKRAMDAFAKGEVDLLVASDLAARGLDIGEVTLVVHFDIPEVPLDYQHRCGRTGRAGREGLSVALTTEYEQARLRDCEKAFGIVIEPKTLRQGTVHGARGERRTPQGDR